MTELSGKLSFPCLNVRQPIGDFYIASIPYRDLVAITYFDVRRVLHEERDVERYLGVQRPLSDTRVSELHKYVQTVDACFPTAVIIAVSDDVASWDQENNVLTLIERPDLEPPIPYRKLARVLDGQHRLAGLEGDPVENFDINVAVFVGADIADQAMIFSTVNLAQTKVQKSLGYDLYELAKTRSPQRVCHRITVTLDREQDSPLQKMIKRLGVATPGRTGETLTQATVVQALLPFVTTDEIEDRDLYLRGKKPEKLSGDDLAKHPFQNLFVDERDFDIVDILWNFFSSVASRWPDAWRKREPGWILNRTNGFRALMRLLRAFYPEMGEIVPTKAQFDELLARVHIDDDKITTEYYKPGTSGESLLFREMRDHIRGDYD